MKLDRSKELQQKSHRLIPGGAHTYAKGDDQYPANAPGFIARGAGCHVWDVDNNQFIEYGMGLRAVTLGHGFAPVVEAAYRAMQQGINFVRPHPLELELAEKMLSLIPSGEMVKFAKNGSDVTTAALKLARAYTGRQMVAICADHPFFSVDDWFIGSTAMAAGIPPVVRQMTVKFRYNDLASLQGLFDQYPSQIAAVFLEAETSEPPQDDFLHKVQALCRKEGALFVMDEIITGFRWHLQGAQAVHQLDPDLSTFGKAMANGFSVAALVGKRDILRLGGLDHDKERVFLLSTTYGAETHGLAAALATIQVYENEDVIEHLYAAGDRLRAGVNQAIAAHHMEEHFALAGRSCNLIFVTKDQQKQRSQPFRTLFMQEIVKRGILAPSFVVSYSHSDADIDATVEAVSEALNVYRKALDEGVENYLQGPSVKPVMRTYNW
ncbi:MAG: glutamate-1-semialdehyde 2,1-aminomutase [Caldilineaceae bacterium]